jgi:high-affinity iron transporter
MGQLQQMRAVWMGIGLAVLASIVGGVALYATVREYDGSPFQMIFETITYLVAVVLLTSMTFWLQAHSRNLKKEIVAKASVAGSGLALGLLAFSTVGREGLETAVFSLALAFQTSGLLLLIGAAFGILAAVGLCWLIYRMGYRLDFRLFFRIMGILLLVFAAGLLADAVQNLQELGWAPFGLTQLWSTARFLSEDSTVGDILHTFLGYADAPTILQTMLYLAYLAVAGTIFWRMTRKGPAAPAKAAVSSEAA